MIVTIRWGVELDTQPRSEQVELGHSFVIAGADTIFGHHAHRLQPPERYRGPPAGSSPPTSSRRATLC